MSAVIRTRADKSGRSSKRFVAGQWSHMNRPPDGEPFVWFSREMLDSPAFRSLSKRALRTLFRLLSEHMGHGGRRNGQLVVSHADLAAYGVADGTQAEAIRELVALGWIAVVEKGGLSYGSANRASRYRLTFLPALDGDCITTWPATNEWKSIVSMDDAKARLSKVLDAHKSTSKAGSPAIESDRRRRG